MLDLLLKNVHLPDGLIKDICVQGGTVLHQGAGVRADCILDCSSYLCLPAGVDMHVHLRSGQESHKEDWETGSRSALAGGVTLVVDQPNTLPPLTTVSRFRERLEDARAHSLCHFGINAGVVPGASLPDLWNAGALAFGEIFLAPSTHGQAISLDTLPAILATARSLDAPCTLHVEGIPLTHHAADLCDHDRSRSAREEGRMVEEVCRRVPRGTRLHFCHLSGAGGIDTACGTREVTPHHLFLSREDFPPSDARGKVNPPLRSRESRQMLWSRWDRIDVIASDHAPHTAAEKRAPFPEAPAGLPGVETMLPLLIAAFLDHRVTLPSLIEKTSSTPSRILGILPPGFSVGQRADFALFPRHTTRITADRLHSRAGWTPYEGQEGVFPDHVFMDGLYAYREGDYFGRKGRWYGGRGFKGPHPT